MWTTASWWHWLGMASFWMMIVVVAMWAGGRIGDTSDEPRFIRTVRGVGYRMVDA